MNRGAIEAYTSKLGSYWLGRAIAFRHAADMAAGYRADRFHIQALRCAMRSSAYKVRTELAIERIERRTAA